MNKEDKKRLKEELKIKITRERLLKALAGKEKRPVNILRKMEDKIPSTFLR